MDLRFAIESSASGASGIPLSGALPGVVAGEAGVAVRRFIFRFITRECGPVSRTTLECGKTHLPIFVGHDFVGRPDLLDYLVPDRPRVGIASEPPWNGKQNRI